MSFYEEAKKVVKANKEWFSVFEELDRTGTFRKPVYKRRVNFTMSEDVFNRFRSYCKKNRTSMSGKLEEFIRTFLKESR